MEYINPNDLTEYEKLVAISFGLNELARVANGRGENDLALTIIRLSYIYDQMATDLPDNDKNDNRLVAYLDNLISS